MKKVLIVDDNEQNLYLLQTMLKGRHYDVLTAANGVEALEQARRDPPAIVISDILMPVMDGFTLCRKWKKDERLQQIPFVFYSATYTDPRDEELALSLGAARFIVKPVDPEAFAALLKQVIEEREPCPPLTPAQPDPEEETDYYQLYSEALVRKLEEKLLQLEEANKLLKQEITERKQVEEELRETQERYQMLFTQANEGIFILSIDGTLVEVNESLARMHGYTVQEMLLKNLKDINTPKTAQLAPERMRRLLDGEALTFEVEHYHKDGHVFPLEVSANLISYSGGSYIQSFHRDITERKKAEQLLADSEDRFRRAVQESPLPTMIHSEDGNVLAFSRVWLEITGYSSDEISTISDWTERAYGARKPLVRDENDSLYALDKRKAEGDHTITCKDGTQRIWNFSSASLGRLADGKRAVISMANDVTEHRKLEEQLRQAQKMESIGQLAGGIAHDFNNILATILGYGEMALMNMPADDPQRLNIEHMLEAADKAVHLTKDILLFSRKHPAEKKPEDMRMIVRNVGKILKRVLGEDVGFKAITPSGDVPIFADKNQLEQVLMNLATNARDAMPQGGTFTLVAGEIALDDEFVAVHGYGKTGEYAMITVADTGCGMDEQTRQKIFEPFFTTKEVGKGTGLGMAVVYGIVKQHDGYITAYSEPGKGTTFRIYLPRISSATRREERAQESIHPERGRGTETILLAEDDTALREVTVTILKEFGYSVITAVDGEHKDSIQLLLLDLIMPKMNGKEAYDEIVKIKPGCKIIFLSGYAPDMVRQRISIEKGIPVLSKPLSPRNLLKEVRTVLDEK
jgi:PAS domain S-box-containing protein